MAANLEFSLWKILIDVVDFFLCFIRCNLPHSFIGCVGFWYENTNIYIALDFSSPLKRKKEVNDGSFFSSFSPWFKLLVRKIISQRKSNHEVKFCTAPAALFCLANNLFKMLRVNFLVKAKLPHFSWSFNGKRQTAFSYGRKFFKNVQRHAVYF